MCVVFSKEQKSCINLYQNLKLSYEGKIKYFIIGNKIKKYLHKLFWDIQIMESSKVMCMYISHK